MDCPGVIVTCCLISEEEVASAIKELRVIKVPGYTGVVGEW